jgi:hypothetical protein
MTGASGSAERAPDCCAQRSSNGRSTVGSGAVLFPRWVVMVSTVDGYGLEI